MTDAEIIKAFETCIGPEVVKLYICNIESEISIITVAEIRDFIKRQQAEIEHLNVHIKQLKIEHGYELEYTKNNTIEVFAEELKDKCDNLKLCT